MSTVNDIIAYLKLELEFVKIKLQKEGLMGLSTVLALISIAIPVSLFVLIFSFALGFLIGEWIGKLYIGFLVISLIYFVVGLGLILNYKKLTKYYFNTIFLAIQKEIASTENTNEDGSRAVIRPEDSTNQIAV